MVSTEERRGLRTELWETPYVEPKKGEKKRPESAAKAVRRKSEETYLSQRRHVKIACQEGSQWLHTAGLRNEDLHAGHGCGGVQGRDD